MEMPVCVNCKKLLSISTRRRKPENRRCRSCAAKYRWENDPNASPVIPCPTCGTLFKAHMRQTGPKQYCSQECRDAPRRITKTCPQCHKEFTVSKSTAHRYNYCSIECARANTEYVICKRCGKRFNNTTQHPRYYCSEECRRPPIIKTCECCGNQFRVTPSDSQTKECRFCSFRCYRKFVASNNESGLERKIRLALETYDIDYEKEYAVGKDIFDFFIVGSNLLIEADGTYWHSLPHVKERDKRKSQKAKQLGFVVERLPEEKIMSDKHDSWLFRLIKKHSLTDKKLIPLQPRLPFDL